MEVDAAARGHPQPAALNGGPSLPAWLSKLVDDLRQVRVPGQEGTVPGQYVEPVQLQVVCYQLWENLTSRPDENQEHVDQEITFEDLAQAGDVDQALTQFYEETLAVAERIQLVAGVSERQLRAGLTRN